MNWGIEVNPTRYDAERQLLIDPEYEIWTSPAVHGDTDEPIHVALVMPKGEIVKNLRAINNRRFQEWMKDRAQTLTSPAGREAHFPKFELLDELPLSFIEKDKRTQFAETKHEAIMASALAANALLRYNSAA